MEKDLTVIAGRNPVMEALRKDLLISRILIGEGDKEGSIVKIIANAKQKGIPIKRTSNAKLDSIMSSHQGVIAYISPIEFVSVEDILQDAKDKNQDPFIIILDHIEDVHNLGAIARSAEAAGCQGIVIPLHKAAPVTPTAVKASAGALLHIKVARVTNLNDTIDYLKNEGVWICGTDMDTDTIYYDANLLGPLALVIGSEGRGMSRLTAQKCDFSVKIPLKGDMTSLNASCAAAIVMFEALKQRDLKG